MLSETRSHDHYQTVSFRPPMVRATSSTIKLRVVFDPNIPGCTGGSLASSMLVGPKLQKEISNLLIHFRLNPVAFTCDIQALYRSILIHPDDRKFHHILWHAKGSKTVTEYELRTCTSGLPPSPSGSTCVAATRSG